MKLFASTLGSHNRVSAFLGALRSFTQFALLNRRIRRGYAKIDIRALLARLIKILVISALSLCLPAMAQDQSGWQFDSLRVDSTVSKTDAQQIYEVLLKMLDRSNAHDIGGYLEAYWKSPELLVVVDSEQFNGWQQLHDSYVNGYPDPNSMGFIQPKRIHPNKKIGSVRESTISPVIASSRRLQESGTSVSCMPGRRKA